MMRGLGVMMRRRPMMRGSASPWKIITVWTRRMLRATTMLRKVPACHFRRHMVRRYHWTSGVPAGSGPRAAGLEGRGGVLQGVWLLKVEANLLGVGVACMNGGGGVTPVVVGAGELGSGGLLLP